MSPLALVCWLLFAALAIGLPGVALQRLLRTPVEPALVIPLGTAWCAGACWLALASGHEAVFPAAILLAGASLLARRGPWRLADGPGLRGALAPFLALVALLALTQYRFNRLSPDGDFLLDPLVTSDSAFHVGLAHELLAGHPPQVPGVAGFPLGYHLRTTLLAAFCGLILAGGSALLIDYLDDTLQTPEDVKQRLGLPILGYIADIRKKKDNDEIMVAEEDRSPVTDSFRSLKNNLEFLGIGKQAKTLIVTSPEQSAGKTTISTNLAVTFAQDGKRVLLIDADLRQPAVHPYFNISHRTGLADVLSNGLDLETVSHTWKKTLYLNVLPSGLNRLSLAKCIARRW